VNTSRKMLPYPLTTGAGETSPDGDRSTISACPNCGRRLPVGASASESHPCRACTHVDATGAPLRAALGLRITYAVVGAWDASCLLEFLFDQIGTVDYLKDGFVCYPDDHHLACPTVMVDEGACQIRFGLFGGYDLTNATVLIHETAAELAGRFQLELRPLLLDWWEVQRGELTVIERRHLHSWRRESDRPPARA